MSDLSELFERDPLLLTDQDVATIIIRMRQAQAQYELGIRSVVAPRQKVPKTSKTNELLKDLGLT